MEGITLVYACLHVCQSSVNGGGLVIPRHGNLGGNVLLLVAIALSSRRQREAPAYRWPLLPREQAVTRQATPGEGCMPTA